jgi:hypothetical protein
MPSPDKIVMVCMGMGSRMSGEILTIPADNQASSILSATFFAVARFVGSRA